MHLTSTTNSICSYFVTMNFVTPGETIFSSDAEQVKQFNLLNLIKDLVRIGPITHLSMGSKGLVSLSFFPPSYPFSLLFSFMGNTDTSTSSLVLIV